jgi:hypothetical protein
MSEGAVKKLEGVAKMVETLIKPVIGVVVFAIPFLYVARPPTVFALQPPDEVSS